jgi:hypothetical protein
LIQEEKDRHDTHPPRGTTKRNEELGDFTTTRRVIPISLLAMFIGALCAFVALAMLRLIGLFTNLFYFGRWSTEMVSPAGNHLGYWSGLVTLEDLLKARTRHVEEERRREQVIRFPYSDALKGF